jgi:O-antigen ligase
MALSQALRYTAHIAGRIRPYPLVALCFVFGCGATACNGASQHGPAFILRAAVAAACWLTWPHPLGRIPHGAQGIIACLLMAYAWGLGWADDLSLAVQPTATLLLAVVVFWGAAAATTDTVATFYDGLFALGTAHSVWAMVQRLTSSAGPADRATGGFFSPIDLAAFLSPLIVWAWHRSTITMARGPRIWRQAAAGTMLVGLGCTGTRSGVLAVLPAVAGVGYKAWRGKRGSSGGPAYAHARAATFIGLAALICAAAYALRYRFAVRYDAYAYARCDIWRACVAAFQASPQGVGLGGLAPRLQVMGVPLAGPVRYPLVANTAHSEVLQAAVEMGVPGLLAVLALMIGLVVTVMRLPANRRAAHGAIGLAFALPALCYTTLHLPCMPLLFALWAAAAIRDAAGDAVAGTAANAQALATTTKPEPGPGRLARGTLAVAVLLLVPGLVAHFALRRATQLQVSGGAANPVARWAALAHLVLPDSCATALAAQALIARGPPPLPPLTQVERWVALAEAYPACPEPLRRAGYTLERMARTPSQWHQVAQLWQEAAARDPHNALLWVQAARAATRSPAPDTADGLWTRAVAEEPHCARAWVGLGEAARVRGDAAAVRVAYAQVTAAVALAGTMTGYAHEVLRLDAQAALAFAKLAAYFEPTNP